MTSAGNAYPSVTVVIPTRGGRARSLERALGTLLADPATTEVIVVFDREDSDTEAMLRGYARSDDRVRVETPARQADPTLDREQLARDTGAELARGEVILALDDDVEPSPGLVTGHAKRHLGVQNLVVLGYMPVRPQGASRGSGQASRIYSEGYERACARYWEDADNVLTGLWGGHLSLRRETWVSVSRNPTRVGASFHVDQEFGLRLRELGARGIFVPELTAAHRHMGSASTVLETARSSGFGQARLHAAYPDAVRAPEDVLADGSPLLRPLLWISRYGVGWLVVTRTVEAAARVADWCRLRRTEYFALLALQRIGFARGAQEGGRA